MKKAGIILNILGIILVLIFIVSYLSGLSEINGHLNSLAIDGDDDGPTSVFYTVKISRKILVIILAFMAIFAFNVWSFIKKQGK